MDEELELLRPNMIASMALLNKRGFNAATFIDIGAAEGGFYLLRRQMDLFPGAAHFFVDAMQENEPVYKKLVAKFGGGYEIAALSCVEGQLAMRIDPDFYNTHVDRLQPDTSYAATRMVPAYTLDSVVERHKLPAPYALKLDVQGGELDALRGALRTLDQAVSVTVEIQIFSERDTLVELLSFMQGRGWALYDLTDLAYYVSDDTFYVCYATFIPKRLDFRGQTPWCLPEQLPGRLAQLRERRARNMEAIEELLANA